MIATIAVLAERAQVRTDGKLDVVGVLCVEFFLTRDGSLLINELAPRPHNSGHLTFDACVTSQFEQQLRAVCGLPLGSTALLRPAAMANLLGDLWANGEPDWAAACAPDRIDRLVLIATSARLGPPESWHERAATVRRDGAGAVADAVASRWFTPAFRERDPRSFAASAVSYCRWRSASSSS